MDPKVILFTLVTIIIISALLHYFVFKKSEEPKPKPEVDFGEEEDVEEEDVEEEDVEEVIIGPSPDAVDEVITGGDDEPVPEEDETSLETAPVDDEIVEETSNVNIVSETSNVNVVVEGYMLKK